MANYVHIQRLIDRGLGIAARNIGQPMSAYRLQANGAVNFLDTANLVQANVMVYRQPSGAGKLGIEGVTLGSPLYELFGDFNTFYVGDVFVQTDPAFPTGYGPGATLADFSTVEINAFCLAFHGPLKKIIGARIDRLAQIYRMASAADTNGYLSAETAASLPVVLSDGTFSVGAVGATAAFVPIGMASLPRWRGRLFADIPTSTNEVVWVAYAPPLPGFLFKEGDRLVLQDGSRYVVQNPYEQMAGLAGSQLMVEREISQN